MKQKHYIAGLYYRLSQEDERQGESVSIDNQRTMLRKYAEELQCAYKLIVFAVIGLFLFKAVHGIHWQSLRVCKIYGFDDSPAPVRSVTKKIDEVVYFTITGKFNGDFFPFAVFAVNFRCFSSCKLIEKAYSGLRYVVAVRYDIVYFVHVM